ncbi:MAG: class I tRNA ligase family protein, partial [Prevotellaceae bacterium]|nr:class I tRNA ligase family protein [Prevotellaceae bacterium]
MELPSKYDPSLVEDKWYKFWLEHKLFHSEPDEREPYTIVIPPPNVTGVLHMGHMLNNSIQDILVRRARMMGKNACWVPGTDHAAIATEAKVVAKLAQEGIKKSDLTREEFLEHVWEWTHKHGGIILDQLKKLGCSCDWDRTCFTMDEKRSESVIQVFIDLYNKGLIYKGVRMVNWDPQAKTALSDEEVIFKEQQGKLYYLRYKIVDNAPPSPPEGGDVGEVERNYGYQTANVANYSLLKEFAQNMRKFSTEAENALWEMLRRKSLDVRFRRQHIIGDFIADFVCLPKKLIIEVDGEYHNEPENVEFDRKRTEILNNLGFNVIRFTNEEVICNTDKVLETIKNALNQTSGNVENTTALTSPPSGGLGGATSELGGAFATVATTRPETIFGDTAMCINPNDPKTAWLKGKKVIVPIVNRVIPVIEDEYVD